jgi:hypothetical protein
VPDTCLVVFATIKVFLGTKVVLDSTLETVNFIADRTANSVIFLVLCEEMSSAHLHLTIIQK